MELKSIAIEDEPLAMQKLEAFIEKAPGVSCVAAFDNALEAMAFLKGEAVDLVFLDIQMEDFTGIQFLETVRNKPRIVITTAYDKYAVQGYEFEVDDYLLKPFTFQRFLQAVEKVARRMEGEGRQGNDFLFLKTANRLEKVRFEDILYVEGMSEYLGIHTPNGRIMTLQSFKSLESSLPAGAFFRVHRSYLIALDKIDSIERNRILIGGQHIPIGETYRKSFFKKIGQ